MGKLKTLSICRKISFSTKLLHAHLQYVWNKSAKCWKDLMKALGGVNYTKYVLSVTIQTRITKWHNSCNTGLSAPFFLPNMHCLTVKVWCEFEQNRTKSYWSYRAKTSNVDGISESRNHGMTDMLKTLYTRPPPPPNPPPKLKIRFAGGIINHNRSTALERSVINYWRRLKPVLRSYNPRPGSWWGSFHIFNSTHMTRNNEK